MILIRHLAAVSLSVLLAFSPQAFGLAADYGAGDQMSHPDSWPPGLLELARGPSRVAGYFINADDYLAFQGDTAGFQRCVDTCAALGEFGRTTLHIHQGKGAFQPLDKTRAAVPCDWQLDVINRQFRAATSEPVSPKYHLDLHVWLGGGVKLDAVKLPAGLEISKD
jgi:hypothetical protein